MSVRYVNGDKEDVLLIKSVVSATLVAVVFVGAGNSAANAQTPNEASKNVVVQQGDSLEKIATQNQTSYTRLYDANPQVQHPDVIHPGDNIRIPAANEQLASRPLPVKVAVVPKSSPVVKKKIGQRYQKRSAPVASASGAGNWDRLAQCEAGGNWNTNTGNGYSGGLQFSNSSWRAAGGSGSAAQASREEQIARAENLKAKQGWGAWPACSKKLGLR